MSTARNAGASMGSKPAAPTHPAVGCLVLIGVVGVIGWGCYNAATDATATHQATSTPTPVLVAPRGAVVGNASEVDILAFLKQNIWVDAGERGWLRVTAQSFRDGVHADCVREANDSVRRLPPPRRDIDPDDLIKVQSDLVDSLIRTCMSRQLNG